MRRDLHPGLSGCLLLMGLVAAAPARAQETGAPSELPRIGLAPGEPQLRSAGPSVPFGVPPTTPQKNVLDFHGYILVPMKLGLHDRENPGPGQADLALHSPPLIPQDYRSFEYTGAIPQTWVQLNFTYGNSRISGTVVLAATALADATGFYNPVEQIGATDAFLTLGLSDVLKTPFEIKVGAMTGRYGIMGAYDQGRYATPLIARTNSVGERVTAGFDLGQRLTLVFEQGFGGQLFRPPVGFVPAGWNDFADPNVGASFVNQLHAGLGYSDLAELGLHYLVAFAQDDQSVAPGTPDGRISVYGADLRFTLGRGGHLYLGAQRTLARDAGTVGGIIEILNARGGPELIEEYLGPNSGGDGALTIFGAQYDVSLARLVYGDLYEGQSPDVLLSLFGMGVAVDSDDPVEDGVLKLKGGAEVTYNMLPWFGVSTRVDHVRADSDNAREAFTIFSPRLLFHTDWQSRDEIALQYSHFLYGGEVVVERGFPPVDDPSVNPDRHVFSLSGTFWW